MIPDTSNGKWDTPLTELSEVQCISRYHLYTSRKAPRAHTLHNALITHISASPILLYSIEFCTKMRQNSSLAFCLLFTSCISYKHISYTFEKCTAHLLWMGLTDHALQWIRIHMTFLHFLVLPYFTLEILTLWTTNYSAAATSEP